MNPPSLGKTVNWGVLGCASVARAVTIPGITLSSNGKVLAVASRNLDRAKEFSEELDIQRAYGSYEGLLQDSDVEAVYIALPNCLHKEWTIKAAEQGKHVLCEKPLSCGVQEAVEMVEACRQNGVLLMEVFAHRFHPQNTYVKKLIDGGRIGRVVWITSVHASGPPPPDDIRLSKELAGGVLMDKGCYCINTARFILESEPISVFARAQFGASGVDERVTATLEFPGDAVVSFDTSFSLAPGTYFQGYEVFGENGRILVPEPFAQLPTYRRGEIVDTRILLTDKGGNTEEIKVDGTHQWQLQVEYFADRVLNGEQIDFPAEDGLLNMKAVEAVYRSAGEGRAVTV